MCWKPDSNGLDASTVSSPPAGPPDVTFQDEPHLRNYADIRPVSQRIATTADESPARVAKVNSRQSAIGARAPFKSAVDHVMPQAVCPCLCGPVHQLLLRQSSC